MKSKTRHDIKNTSWRQKVPHDVKNTLYWQNVRNHVKNTSVPKTLSSYKISS